MYLIKVAKLIPKTLQARVIKWLFSIFREKKVSFGYRFLDLISYKFQPIFNKIEKFLIEKVKICDI